MTSKLLTTLTTLLYENNNFKNDYRSLLLAKFSENHHSLTNLQIKKLLESAAIFALDENDSRFQKLAFKIAIFLLEKLRNDIKFIPFVSQIILARLGDLPTIKHMVDSEHGKDYFSFFNNSEEFDVNYIQFPEITSSMIFNQVKIADTEYNLTDFQTKVLLALQRRQDVSFSAPTSAGKSFIVHQFIAEKLKSLDEYCVVYVAPTRSLIKEIHDTVIQNLRIFGIDSKDVLIFSAVSKLNIEKIMNIKKKILVMTQERLQQMLSNGYKITVNLLVVDEAQKVSEEDRGVIIEDAVQELISNNVPIQKIFISPNTNPENFKQIFGLTNTLETFRTSKTPVGQNFFDIVFSKDSKDVAVSIWSQELGESVDLYTKTIVRNYNQNLISTRKAIVVTDIIKRKDPTLVYCNTRKDCRTVCDYISEFSQDIELTTKLQETIDFVRTHVHTEYYLLDYLKKGIGYHYGKMPHFVRIVVKDLYENKHIDTLCCTSTLVEGVNLPAKNVVLHNPKLGNRILMDKSGINNIAGRAGRLSKDYYGDIYCIDRIDWEEKEPFDQEVQSVESATEKILTEKTNYVLSYLENPLSLDEDNRGPRSVAISLMMKRLNGSNVSQYLRSKCKDMDVEQEKMILNYIDKIITEISLNGTVILRNRDFDPRFQNELYEYLKNQDNLVLPPDPTDKDNFYNDLLEIFRIISEILFKIYNRRYVYIATLSNQWILGVPYKVLLERKIQLNNPKPNEKRKTFINRMIDDLDDDIEDLIKFQYTRGLQCYCDVVEQILNERNDQSYFCKELPEYLEAGAFDKRIFILMDVGFTRLSTHYLYEQLDPHISDVEQCLIWLRQNRQKLFDWLPISLHHEVDFLLGKVNL